MRALGPCRSLAPQLLLACAAATACQSESAPPRTNVVLIVIDSLRADALGSYGNPRPATPQIDALAAVGLRYERAVSQAPWTTPSIASLLTSRYPSALGIEGVLAPLPEGVPALPELLRDAGYATGAIVSHYFCSARWGFSRGFDSFDESHLPGHFGISSPGVSDAAIAFLDAHRERPFFLFVHYFDPHFSYLEHEEFAFRDADHAYDGPVHPGVPIEALRFQPARFDEDDLRELRRIYDSEVAFTDHHVGRVLDHLRRLGLFESSLLVLTADHGEEFREHGDFGHGETLYEELLRVPLILKIPGVAPGVVREPVALLDVMPTLADALALPLPEGVAGRSLLRPRPDGSPVFAETRLRADLRSVTLGNYKLIHDGASDRYALYDLAADPGERHDVRARDRVALRALKRQLERWVDGAAPARPESAVPITSAERRLLRELGYLE